MSVKVTDNTAQIKFQKDAAVSLALRYMLDAIDLTANPRTPKDQGNLRRDLKKQVLGKRGTIQWLKDYAIFQELKQFQNYTTSGTGPHFAENAVRKVTSQSDMYFKKARLII